MRVCLLGSKSAHLITNWGPAAFTQAELEERQKSWKEKKTTEWAVVTSAVWVAGTAAEPYAKDRRPWIFCF